MNTRDEVVKRLVRVLKERVSELRKPIGDDEVRIPGLRPVRFTVVFPIKGRG